MLEQITDLNDYEGDVVAFTWAGYVLKFVPIFTPIGFLLDFIVDVIIIIKKDLRTQIYDFLLD